MNLLLEKTIQTHIDEKARLLTVNEFTGAQGYSGAAVRYFAVEYCTNEGSTRQMKLVVKDAPLVGRRVLQRLGKQLKTAVPFSATDDLTTDSAMPICQQFIPDACRQLNTNDVQQLATKLAQIHAANMNKANELNWVPKVNIAFFQDFIFADWRKQWDLTNQDSTFAPKFGFLQTQIDEAASLFLAEIARIHQEGKTLTLIHADLHRDHIRFDGEHLYLIDFDDARYGTFYLDLPNVFNTESVWIYKQKLDALLKTDDDVIFHERFRLANQYVGFKYMGFSLWRWRAGDADRDEGLERMINRALGK